LTRIKRGVTKTARHKKVLLQARGFRAAQHRSYKRAKEALTHAGRHAFRHRRERKGDFRRLWIIRIGAAVRQRGLTYGQFMHGLKEARTEINRKMLADIATQDPSSFDQLVILAKGKGSIA